MLTFEHYTDVNECPEITFDEKLNILIGTNASGKSNFLEIINSLFKSILILGCTFNEGVIAANVKDPERNPLTSVLAKRVGYHNLPPNHQSNIQEQKIKVKLQLEEGDLANLKFLIEKIKKINEFLQKYSRNIPLFNEKIIIDELKKKETVEFTFSGNAARKSMDLQDDFGSDETLRFVFFYFYYFEFLQNVIFIANRFQGEQWEPLNMLCALISSYRNYDKIEDTYQVLPTEFDKLQPIYNKVMEESTRKASEKEPPVFEFTRHKLAYKLDEIEYLMVNNRLSNSQNKTSLQILNETSTIYSEINKLLKSNLKLRLEIHKKEKSSEYKFTFIDLKSGVDIDVFELSSGEKGLIHFIFSLYGYEIKNGVMIIDEPELHLHPQIQSKYLDIIDAVRDKLGIQFIFATHSPVFINLRTIQSVYRFFKENGYTRIVKPTIIEPEKDLIHFLTYTNSAKIFFADKVVLVEGDKDHYFFQYYLNNYKIRKKRDITGVEFLVINGKGEFEKWKNFLDKYKIKTYYIGDLDNLLLNSISSDANYWRNIFSNTLRISQINSLKSANSPDYHKMQLEIASNYSRGLFLISNGSLEDNLKGPIGREPGFDDIIKFCMNNFNSWITNQNNPFINEIDFFMRYLTH